MTSNQAHTGTNPIQTTADDVEGHRIAAFIEDYKDAAMTPAQPTDDVEGHLRMPFIDDETDEDVEGHARNF